MVRHVLRVPRGEWLIQTAAGSALGRMVIRLGQMYDFRTLNVVRRREQAEELLKAGGTAVVAFPEESLRERVHEWFDLDCESPYMLLVADVLPARRLGLAGKKGIIAVGADADLVVLTPELRVAGVMTRGAGLA